MRVTVETYLSVDGFHFLPGGRILAGAGTARHDFIRGGERRVLASYLEPTAV
jgi:hypothetical protein